MTTVNTPPTPKVALVTNMLPPYRVSFYQALSKNSELTVVLDTLSEFNRSWEVEADSFDFSIETQNCRSFVYTRTRDDVNYQEKRQFHFSEKTFSTLKRIKPDVIITAEFGLRTIWSLLYGYLFKTPVIIASEGTLHTEGHVGAFKRFVRRVIVSQCERFWSNGPESTELLISYGARKEGCDEGMTGIETTEWRQQVESFIPSREKIRRELDLSGRTFLFSGSLSPRKGIPQLLDAAATVATEGGQFSLIILGGGEYEKLVEEFKTNHPQIAVHVPGFIQREQLPKYFAAADWAILPTLDDNWPLATLETLVAGLPQLFSIYNGATSDLCRDGITGLKFDPLDPANFVAAWQQALNSEDQRISAELVEEFAQYYSPSQQASRAQISIRKAIEANRDLNT